MSTTQLEFKEFRKNFERYKILEGEHLLDIGAYTVSLPVGWGRIPFAASELDILEVIGHFDDDVRQHIYFQNRDCMEWDQMFKAQIRGYPGTESSESLKSDYVYLLAYKERPNTLLRTSVIEINGIETHCHCYQWQEDGRNCIRYCCVMFPLEDWRASSLFFEHYLDINFDSCNCFKIPEKGGISVRLFNIIASLTPKQEVA
jgi:hypothetical protein